MAEHRRFFGLLCAHKWQTKQAGPLFDGDRRAEGRPIGQWAFQQCEHCGKLKYRMFS